MGVCFIAGIPSPLTPRNLNKISFYAFSVSAGFPSPAEDYLEKKLDLHELLIKRPAATFFLRVGNEVVPDIGLQVNDILVVDRSITPSDGKLVVAAIDGHLAVKRLHQTGQGVCLTSDNPRSVALKLDSDDVIWGVITSIIHRLK